MYICLKIKNQNHCFEWQGLFMTCTSINQNHIGCAYNKLNQEAT